MGERKHPEYVKLKDFVALSGLSESTVRRRVRDGSLAAVQVGGKGKKLLFLVDALERIDAHDATPHSATDAELNSLFQSPGTSAGTPSGPRPRWAQSLPRHPK
jgi:hypothetical protein